MEVKRYFLHKNIGNSSYLSQIGLDDLSVLGFEIKLEQK